MYTKDNVKRIFEKEKILVGNDDGFPKYRALEIFGVKAVEFSKRLCEREGSGVYGIGGYQFEYLTLKGLYIAATYDNICAVRDIITEKGGACHE